MGSKKRQIRRRTPVQERSATTVDVLLEATAQVLLERGYEAASTNAIARRAGVSIGSLYQYFADKDMLVIELARRHYSRLEATVHDALHQRDTMPPPAWIEHVLRSLMAVLRTNPGLTQVIAQQIPRVGALRILDALEARVEVALAGELARVRGHLRPDDLALAAQVVVRAVAGVLQATLRRSPPATGGSAADNAADNATGSAADNATGSGGPTGPAQPVLPVLEDAIVELVLRYLLRDPGDDTSTP